MAEAVSSIHRAEAWRPGLDGERVVDGIHYGWLMKDHVARYEMASAYSVGKRVLDVATGTGYGANILRLRGASEVTAVDLEQAALDYARMRYGEDGLNWVNADACTLPFGREFDVVCSFETIEHLKDPAAFVAQCKRVLKPGGVYILSTPLNTGGDFVSPYHELEFTVDELRGLLARHFPNVTLFGQRRGLSLAFKPLGNLPSWYWKWSDGTRRGSHKLYTLLDRANKAPNHFMAWAMGLGEAERAAIRPLDAPMKRSFLLKPNYFIIIGICRLD
jgi:SAM-dependent methyltransferase